MTPAKLRGLRDGLAAALELLHVVIDDMDGDPDLEETGDEEPSLGWTERGPAAGGINNDCEQDDCDCEDGGDDEPSLGWTTSGALCGDDDREHDPAEMGEPEDEI